MNSLVWLCLIAAASFGWIAIKTSWELKIIPIMIAVAFAVLAIFFGYYFGHPFSRV